MAERSPDELRQDLAALRLDRAAPAPRSRRRLIVVLLLLVAVGVVVAVRAAGRRKTPVEVAQVTTVEPRGGGPAAVPVLSGAGYVVSAERYIAIGARVAGRIERYHVEEGDRVAAGDPLVQLDQREYQAAVHRAEASLVLARATADLRAKQLVRANRLARSAAISHEELDVRAAEAATADATVSQAEAELAQARVALEYTTLRSPTPGVILAKLKEVGEIAVPGGFSGSGDLIRLANLVDLRGQVDVTEAELAKVRLGQQAEVAPDAYPDRRYDAKVVKLYPQVDRQKGTLRVEVQIARPDEQLWPDMSARITFFEPVAGSATRAVLVPRSAVRTIDGRPSAWVVDDGRVRGVAVATGSDFGEQVQVTSGLTGGETVVVGEGPQLVEGQAVEPSTAH